MNELPDEEMIPPTLKKIGLILRNFFTESIGRYSFFGVEFFAEIRSFFSVYRH